MTRSASAPAAPAPMAPTPIAIATPLVEIPLELRPAGPAFALYTRGGAHLVANLSVGVSVTRAEAACLLLAWLAKGRALDWQETDRALAQEAR